MKLDEHTSERPINEQGGALAGAFWQVVQAAQGLGHRMSGSVTFTLSNGQSFTMTCPDPTPPPDPE